MDKKMKYQTKQAIESMIKALDRFLNARAKIHKDDEAAYCEYVIDNEIILCRDILAKRNALLSLIEKDI